ncbi:MAG: hypothetical protein IKV03_02235 [Alphaproteobacteria bacterium]|nr:hypothetical protein [Alphaproteobacteria bacterium]
MSLKHTLLTLSLGGAALTSCSTMQNQSLNDISPSQPTPITQPVQQQEAAPQEEKIEYPTINISPNVNAEKFQQNFTSLTESLEHVNFGKNPQWQEVTLYALHDLAQYEFGQQIIANAPAGIAFNAKVETNQDYPASYVDSENLIYLNDYLYKGENYSYVLDILAHEITHGVQWAHGRTNSYLCSPVESVILNKLCEAEALSIGSIASTICEWQLNTPENIAEFVNYDFIGWYKNNWKGFNEEDYKKTDPTYLFQQALKTTGNIELATRITTGQIAKTYIQKNPTESALAWQEQYDKSAIDSIAFYKDKLYFSGGNPELFQHNIQYYKDNYGLTNADLKMGLSQDMEIQLVKSILDIHKKNGFTAGNDELKWQKEEAELFLLRIQAAKSVDEIRDSMYYFKYSKPEHSVEAQALLISGNPVAQEALTQLTKEGFLKYDIYALVPQNQQQISTLRNVQKDYCPLIIQPQKKSFLDITSHPSTLKKENISQYFNGTVLRMNNNIFRQQTKTFFHAPIPSILSGYMQEFHAKKSSR